MARKLRPGIAAEAKQRQHEGQKSGGRGRKKLPVKFTESIGKESRQQVAAAVGTSWRTLDKAEAVVKSADKALIAEMNRTKRVGGAQPPVPRFVPTDTKRTPIVQHAPRERPVSAETLDAERVESSHPECHVPDSARTSNLRPQRGIPRGRRLG